MQISETEQKQNKSGKHAAGIILFVLALILTNVLLSFLIEPYKSSSQEMWDGYAARRTNPPDTIIVGTSQGLSGISPVDLDSVLGSSSYNMSTNMQSIASSAQIVRTAVTEYHVKRVLLVVDYEVLDLARKDSRRAEQSLWMARARSQSFPESAATVWNFVTDDAFIGTSASLTFFTPWVYNRNTDVRENIQEKLSGKVIDSEGHRREDGYEPSTEQVNPDSFVMTLEGAADWESEGTNFQDLVLSDENRSELTALCEFCRENGVELTALCVPYLNFMNIYRISDYAAMYDELTALFGAYGYDFYDFNLTRPEYYEKDMADFKDLGHMNTSGAEKFSAFLGEVLKNSEAGEEQNDLFYDPWSFAE